MKQVGNVEISQEAFLSVLDDSEIDLARLLAGGQAGQVVGRNLHVVQRFNPVSVWLCPPSDRIRRFLD